MTVSMERYAELLHKFSRISAKYITSEVLDELKAEYKEKIDSIRVLEAINNLTALLKVLDNRGILKYNDFSVLRHISTWFPRDPIIEELFLKYDIWLKENSSQINYLYCCESTNQKSEEQYTDHLLLTESHANIEIQTVQSFPFHNYWKKCKIKRYDRSSTIIFLSLILFTGVTCILVTIFYQSLALVPLADSRAQNSAEQIRSNMPVYVSNVNMGNINAVSFGMNENQNLSMNHPTTTSSIVRDMALKDMIKKKLSRKVGRFWEDVSRRLKLEESVIEDIERKFFNESQGFEKMFSQALELYFAEHHPKWKIELMKALEDSRRRDLKEMVQEMIEETNSN